MQLLYAFLNTGNTRTQVGAIQSRRDHHIPQQVIAPDFRWR